ncbi:MAG: hypothetical protein FD146_1893 [Anaerolineaceae bacterium]|nr:MAG: hypothetical protein FD146_1893 [Anaerolineaceae bacterium]
MKTRMMVSILVAAALLLAACGRPATTVPPPPQTSAAPLPTATRTPTATAAPVPRSAKFTEILNTVEARLQGSGDFAPASVGQAISAGGEARSGEDGRARLDLLPEGSIVRIGPNSSFVLKEIAADPVSPSTRLELLLGQLWIILNGGALDVETPNGLAAVRGSYLGVSYNPETDQTVITCLEGSCTLENGLGKVELTNGEMAVITGNNPPEGPFPMTQDEFDQWFENTLEAWDLLASGGYTPPAGLATPETCFICTPGYAPTVAPTTQTPLPPTPPPFIPTIVPTFPFPTH